MVPLACVHMHAFSSIHRTRYLLRAHCVQALLLSSCGCVSPCRSCFSGGLVCASLSPNCYLFVSLGVSGSVCPCVHFSVSLSLCKALFVSLFLYVCPFPLPMVPSGFTGSLQAGACQWPGSLPDPLPAPSLPPWLCQSVPTEPFLALSSMRMCLSLQGALSWCPGPWSQPVSQEWGQED
jgi:hypothetical protein